MAYSFDGGTQFIYSNTPVSNIQPVTMCGWAYPLRNTVYEYHISVTSTSTNQPFMGLSWDGNSAGDPFYFAQRGDSGTTSTAVSTSTFSTNTWAHAAGNSSSASSRSVFFNGGNKGTDSSSTVAGTFNRFSIAALSRTTNIFFFYGYMAEVAVWNAALNDDEILSLSKGFKPLRVRPQSLVFYAPLINNLQDLSRGIALTNVNSATAIDHPRVY